MKQKLLTDIELDVHELKYLMESFSKEPTQTLSELLKRSIARMQEHLDELSKEIGSVEGESLSSVPSASSATVVAAVTAESVALSADIPSDTVVTVAEPVSSSTDTSSLVVPSAAVSEERKENADCVSEEEVAITVPSCEPVRMERKAEEEPKAAILGESIRVATNLRQSISLNDSFRFSRELFRGDTDMMNRVIEQISEMSSYKTAVAYLASKIEMDEEKEAVNDFLELLKKFFNQSA